MQLSAAEKKLIERLKKCQKALIRFRWFVLFIAIISFGNGMAIIKHIVCDSDLSDPLNMFVITFLTPLVYVFFGVGLWLLIYLVFRWNGNPETRLLLKMLDELQSK